MNKRLILNMVLLLVVVALAAFVYFKNTRPDDTPKLTNLDRDQVKQIVIVRDKGDILFSKQHDRWYMNRPYAIAAEEFRIKRLLDLLDEPVDKAYAVKAVDLQSFALDKPRAVIRFDDTEIRMGKTNPVNGKRYIQVGDKLYLISENIYPLIASQPSSFVSLKLIPGDTPLTAIELPDIKVKQDDKGSWISETPSDATPDQLAGFAANWKYARAFAVHAYLHRDDTQPVTLKFSDQSERQLEMNITKDWVILADKQLGLEYHFDQNYRNNLLQLPKPRTDKKETDKRDTDKAPQVKQAETS